MTLTELARWAVGSVLFVRGLALVWRLAYDPAPHNNPFRREAAREAPTRPSAAPRERRRVVGFSRASAR